MLGKSESEAVIKFDNRDLPPATLSCSMVFKTELDV